LGWDPSAKVIVPNLSLREADVEVFEDDPDEFIRRDIEGSGKNDLMQFEPLSVA
jgi:exportin-2 (importin alpha re-exporter)